MDNKQKIKAVVNYYIELIQILLITKEKELSEKELNFIKDFAYFIDREINDIKQINEFIKGFNKND